MVTDEMGGSKKDIPDLVLVRKIFPKYRKKNRTRYWKLKHLNMEVDDGAEVTEEGTKPKKKKKWSKVDKFAA